MSGRVTEAWKACERRVCRAFGGERCGNRGQGTSDCVGTPFGIEVTRTKGRRFRPAKWRQAQTNAAKEGLPAVLVIADYGDRLENMDCMVKLGTFLREHRDAELYRELVERREAA